MEMLKQRELGTAGRGLVVEYEAKTMAIGRFLAGIGALVWDPAENKYLLLRRSDKKDFAAGAWECVTGRVDQGEGFEDALRREVCEETGLTVQPHFIIGTTHFYRGDSLPENELVGLVYFCSITDHNASQAKIRLTDEHDRYRWVTAGQALELLNARDSTEHWLRKVIKRAEITRKLLPVKLVKLHQRYGFELDEPFDPDASLRP